MLKDFLLKLKNRYYSKKYRDFLLKLMPKNSICAEIGVWKGDFSARILKLANPERLHLIDPYLFQGGVNYKNALYGGKAGSQQVLDATYNSVLEKFSSEITKGKVVVHRKSSKEASNDFPDNYFDWIYIDGDHQYEFVKKDLELFMKKVKTGGYITGDDYSESGWWKGGVKKAVDEFLDKGLIIIPTNLG